MIAMKVTIKWITTDMIQIHVKTILMVIMMMKLMKLIEIQGKMAGTCTILSQRMFMMIEMRVGRGVGLLINFPGKNDQSYDLYPSFFIFKEK